MSLDLLFELGCEDLPPHQVVDALDELAKAFAQRAKALRIEHGTIHRLGTPRRLALLVEAVAERQTDLEEERVGPPASAAYDAQGALTRAALGFLESAGATPDSLRRVSIEKKKGKPAEYIAVTVRELGRPSVELLPALLQALPHELHWPKTMRWGHCRQAFARPVHWLLTRFGSDILPVHFAEVDAAGVSYGHRFHSPGPIEIPTPADYLPRLAEHKVLASLSERRERTLAAAREAAARTNGMLLDDPALLDEITQLIEYPVPILGRFDEAYLALPSELLVTTMRKHQRYFSVVDEAGKSLPYFITIANTEVRDPEVVARGNQRVLRARLEDAQFFYREDQKQSLDAWNQKLERVTYVEGLGSVAAKVSRIRRLAAWLAERLAPDQAQLIDRAAELCKADLVTGLVGEFPELQGMMGGDYAARQGEPQEVAAAIAQHYDPKGAADAVARSQVGAIVAIADKIDSIASLFALGRIPTGAADPFALRRAALGIIRTVVEKDLRFSPIALIDQALAGVSDTATGLGSADKVDCSQATRQKILDFLLTRLRHHVADRFPIEVVDAVLALGARLEDFPAASARLIALQQLRQKPDFEPFALTFKRVANIAESQEAPLDTSLCQQPEEQALAQLLEQTRGMLNDFLERRDYDGSLAALVGLRPTVDTFFDAVLVNAPEPALRANRHALLANVLALFSRIADVRRL
jgi:glycyl-tRNA synthetase beta chain